MGKISSILHRTWGDHPKMAYSDYGAGSTQIGHHEIRLKVQKKSFTKKILNQKKHYNIKFFLSKIFFDVIGVFRPKNSFFFFTRGGKNCSNLGGTPFFSNFFFEKKNISLLILLPHVPKFFQKDLRA